MYRNEDAARYAVKRLAAAAGVQYRGVHALRHHDGSRLLGQTGNLRRVQSHLRHAHISTAAVYTHDADAELQDDTRDW